MKREVVKNRIKAAAGNFHPADFVRFIRRAWLQEDALLIGRPGIRSDQRVNRGGVLGSGNIVNFERFVVTKISKF